MRTLPLPAFTCLLAGLSACVVPAGQEWSDPQANYPPTISEASPPNGSWLVRGMDAGGPLEVTVWLADQNTHDRLYVRWIIDYPPYVDGMTRLAPQVILPAANQIERPPLSFAPDCNADQIAAGFTSHRLLMAASDRPFVSEDPGQAPDQVPIGNARVEGVWQFEMDCP
jgi:hypothetical protein